MFRLCVIGCGSIAEGFHGPSYKKYRGENPGFQLAACCDINREKARSFAERFIFNAFYTDYKEMLEAEKPDAVCVTTPYEIISSVAVDVMNMGFPVLLEKPPGSNREETLKIIEAAEKTGLPNQVAFNRRFTPILNELKNTLGSGDFYKSPYFIRCVFHRVGRKDRDFYTTAIHGIDAVRYLAGSDYDRVRFSYQELPDTAPGAANIYMDCLMKSGGGAHLSFCPYSGKVIEDFHITRDNNDYYLKMPVWGSPDYPGGLTHFSGNAPVARIDGGEARFGRDIFEKFGFYDENAAFFNDLRAGKKPENDIRSALQSMEIADCINKRLTEYKAGSV